MLSVGEGFQFVSTTGFILIFGCQTIKVSWLSRSAEDEKYKVSGWTPFTTPGGFRPGGAGGVIWWCAEGRRRADAGCPL